MKFKSQVKLIHALRAFGEGDKHKKNAIHKSTSAESMVNPVYKEQDPSAFQAARLSVSLPSLQIGNDEKTEKKSNELLVDMRTKYDKFKAWKKVRAEIQNIVQTPHLHPHHVSVLNEMEVS